MEITVRLLSDYFKFGLGGVLTVPLPSPAEKGDREAVDEESICKPTYRDYSYASTTMRIEVLRQLIQLLVFLGARIQKAVGKLATHPERWFTSVLLIHRFAVPLLRWRRQGNGQRTDKPKFENKPDHHEEAP